MLIYGVLSGLVAMLGWGIGDVFLKKPSEKFHGVNVLFYTHLIMLLFSVPVFIIFLSNNQFSLSLTDALLILILAGVDLFAFLNYFHGLKVGELSVMAPISALYSIVTVILSVIFLNEVLTRLNIVAIGIAIIGIILTSTDLKNIHKIHTSKGIWNAVLSMFGWGVYMFMAGILEERIGWQMTFFLTTAALVIALASYKTVSRVKEKKTINQYWKSFAIAGFLYTIAWLFVNIGISVSLVSIVSVISSMAPAVTVVLAVLFLNEKLVLNQVIGIITILVGLFLISL